MLSQANSPVSWLVPRFTRPSFRFTSYSPWGMITPEAALGES
jgi:hypothetical protein